MVIPIESSLLYVMPIYLISGQTQLPEIKRVIAVLGDNISMAPTLDEALSNVVGSQVNTAAPMGKRRRLLRPPERAANLRRFPVLPRRRRARKSPGWRTRPCPSTARLSRP